MKILEKTIYKKKNEKIKNLQDMIIDVSKKSEYNYEENRELKNKINLLEDEKDRLESKIHQINDIKVAYIKQINRFNKIYQETKKSFQKDLKSLNNKILSKDTTIKSLKKELSETQKKLEESMTDKFLVRKVRPATRSQKQTMKIKSGYIEGKIISKVKEKLWKQ